MFIKLVFTRIQVNKIKRKKEMHNASIDIVKMLIFMETIECSFLQGKSQEGPPEHGSQCMRKVSIIIL